MLMCDIRVKVLAVVLACCFLQVSGNACTGVGDVGDTCPEGQYCDDGQCHNCSLCSVIAIQGGFVFDKCRCVLESSKICEDLPVMPGGVETQLIQDPSQLFEESFEGYEYLNESYDRKGLDCTVPTDDITTESVTTVSITPSPLPKISSEMTISSHGTTKDVISSCPTEGKEKDDSKYYVIGIVVLVLIVIALAIWIILLHRGKCMIPHLRKEKEVTAPNSQADRNNAGDTELNPLQEENASAV